MEKKRKTKESSGVSVMREEKEVNFGDLVPLRKALNPLFISKS